MRSIDEDIKNQKFRTAYLLYGEEAYLKKQYKDKLKSALWTEGDTMNAAFYQGKETNPKELIDLGETIQMEVMDLSEEVSDAIRTLPHVIGVSYDKGLLKVRFSKGKHNLLRLLDLLKEKEIAFGNVHSELPTLNDVFLEITGKELRD